MFDFRYHVASLAAVFLALIVGIVLGVGISEEGFVAESERAALENEIAARDRLLEAATRRESALAGERKAAQALLEEAYPVVVREMLRGKRVALVFVGSIDARVRSSVEQALTDAGAPPAVRVRALKVPVDVRTIARTLQPRPGLASYVGADALGDLGHALGEELVNGGQTPLWDALAADLVEEQSGLGDRPADGVVVARSVKPQRGGTARFLKGLYSGLGANGVPAVGVETLDASPSAIKAFRAARISTVDAVDTRAGRLALTLLLAGGRPGAYGMKQSAERVLPPLDSVPPTETAGG